MIAATDVRFTEATVGPTLPYELFLWIKLGTTVGISGL